MDCSSVRGIDSKQNGVTLYRMTCCVPMLVGWMYRVMVMVIVIIVKCDHMLPEQGINSGQIVQLTCKSNINGKNYFVIGKRFDKKCIELVESNDVENVSNYDNSFFEIQRFQGVDNRTTDGDEGDKEQPIKFGDEIKFRHINSGKYLSVAREYTDASKGSFKILLHQDKKPADITFQIMPHRTFEKLADPVRYRAKVNIYNQEEDIYLNIEGSSRDQNLKMKALVGTHVAESQWEINFYAPSYNPTNQVIRDKDLVYMVNSKSSGLLTLLPKPSLPTPIKGRSKDSDSDFVLKQLPINYPIKRQPKSFDCIWQISIRSGRQQITNKMGNKKGSIQLDISFTHLIEEKQLVKEMITRLVYPQQFNNKILDGKSQGKAMPGQTIASGEYIRLGKAPQNGPITWLGQKVKSNHKKYTGNTMMRNHNCTLKNLDFIQHQGDSVVFQIVRIPQDLKKQIHQFIEARQRIQSFMDVLKENESSDQKVRSDQTKRFKQAQQILKHISQSLNVPHTEKNYMQTILQRQMILNDIGFINVIMTCLDKLHIKDKLEKSDQNKKLCNQFHVILRDCCKDNKEIKSSLSKDHLLQLLELSDIEANDSSDTETLKQIMKDNKFAIQNVMNPEQVKKLIKSFSSQPISISVYSKFIQILRLICKTTEEVIPRNQKVVIQEFLQKDNVYGDSKDRNVIRFDFKLNQKGKVKIVTPRNERSNNEPFPEIDEEIYIFFKSNIMEALTFLQWIELVSDVCEGKNIYGKYFAESKFAPRVLEAFIKLPANSTLDENDYSLQLDTISDMGSLEKRVKFVLQGYIVRLINNAFVKTIYHQKRTFDRIYQNKRSYTVDKISSDMSSFFNKVVEFIDEFIKMLKDKLSTESNILRQSSQKEPKFNESDQSAKESMEHQVRLQETIKNVFTLLKNMILYGLYAENSQSLNPLIQNLLVVLEFKGKDTSFKPQILEIINFYMNLDLKQRVENVIIQAEHLVSADKSQQDKKTEIRSIIQNSKPKRFDQSSLKKVIRLLLQFIRSNDVKDKSIFLLCLNTLSKFVEVERMFLLRLKETLIIDRSKNTEVIQKLQNARKCFEVCEIKDLKGVSLENQHELNKPIWDMERECVIRHILEITEAMKDQATESGNQKFIQIYKCSGDPQYLLSAYTECEKPNPKIQKMVKEMYLHKYFYSYIKEFRSDVEEKLSKKLLQIIYLCLAVFAWKNYQNKNQLNQLLPHMLQHAQHNNGSIEVLREFFSENPGILYDQQKITNVTETITNYIYIKTLEYPKDSKSEKSKEHNLNYAAKLLDFFNALISADNNNLGRNRILVLSYILDKDRLQITRPAIIDHIYTHPESKRGKTQSEKTYLCVLFGLLARLVDKESINIAKCKKLHKLEVLVTIMQKVDDQRLKAATRDYVNKLYYSTMDNSYMEPILNTELQTFYGDLNKYIKHRLGQQKSNDKYKNPVKYTYVKTCMYLNLEKILDSLELIVKSPHFESEIKKASGQSNSLGPGANSHQLAIKVVQIYQRLRFIYINFFFDDIQMKSSFTSILKYCEISIFQFSFEKRQFLYNSNSAQSKNIDIKSLTPKGNLQDQEMGYGGSISERSEVGDHHDQLSMCARMLSNTQIGRFFEDKNSPKTQLCSDRVTVLSLVANKFDGTSMMDRRYELKTSVAKILESMLRKKPKALKNKLRCQSQKKVNLSQIFQTLEYPLVGIVEEQNKVQPGLLFKQINTMISENFQIFQPKTLTFYFRTLSHTIQREMDKREQHNDSNTFLISLNVSFSQLMFKTITSCNLQENIEVSYEFFRFVASYWDTIKQDKSQPERLFELIHLDPKNEFLVKLDNFIVFLSNDIVRKLEQPDSQRQAPLMIFDLGTESFKKVSSIEYGYLNKKVESQNVFQTFRNIFKFMQLLCENNFVLFKIEFREQKMDKSIKTNNRNLLIRSTIELRKLFRMYKNEIKNLPEEILDFLNQIAQIPCYDNQIELSKSTFFEDVCQFISDFVNKELPNPDCKLNLDVQRIIEKFFKILLSLLESNLTQIYVSFIQKLDPNFFENVFKIHKKDPQYQANLKDKQSRISKLMINMLIIRKQLQTKTPKDTKLLPQIQSLTGGNSTEMYSIDKIESIQVRLDDKQHKLYFFKPEQAQGVDNQNEYIQTINSKLNRSTHLQKLDSLLSYRRDVELYMVYQNYLRKSNYSAILMFLKLNNWANLFSLLINVILMATTSIVIVGDYVNSFQSWKVLLPLQIIQFVLGTLYFFSDAINNKMKTELDKYNQKFTPGKTPEAKFLQLEVSEWVGVLNTISPGIIYYLVCILGLFVSPYYYSIHLLYWFGKFEVLENVFKAVISNIYQLMYLAILGITFFVVFSILTIDTYAPFASEEYCNSIWECFLVIYNKQIFMEESDQSETRFKSLTFQVLYSVFFGSLFGNIISGLMTDTFAELRDKQNEILQDESNYCYICGCSRFQIQRENTEKLKLSEIYAKHQAKHNKLSYLFYLYQLQKKKKTEYTGLEYIISKKVQKNSVVWFPMKKTEENPTINEIKEELDKLERLT